MLGVTVVLKGVLRIVVSCFYRLNGYRALRAAKGLIHMQPRLLLEQGSERPFIFLP